MERLRALVGHERSLSEVAQTLHFTATELAATTVGAMLVTCSDESEHECEDAFQHGFVHFMLPRLKFARQSAFRLANLGGRYEWGAVRIAGQHFAMPTKDSTKLMVVKVNAHVAYEEAPPQTSIRGITDQRRFRFGKWKRYDVESPCCGTLDALLKGGHEPFTNELREAFLSEGRDRIGTLLDDQRVDPTYRVLYAAIVSARLQARKVVLDIQDYASATPTFYLVLPCATINRHERDTEIVCGLYTIDTRGDQRDATYFGLGDDPSGYEIRTRNRRFIVTDEHIGAERKGRDHRAMALEALYRRADSRPLDIRDERLDRIHRDVQRNKHRHHHHARALLRAALPILAEIAPVPAAVLMFAEGAAGIQHAFRIQQLTHELADSEQARQILDEVHAKVDQLDPDRAEALIEMLMREYRG